MIQVSLTEAARARISLILTVILWICVSAGLVLAGMAAYIKYSLSVYTEIVENYDGTSLPVYLGVTGIIVAISHSLGGVVLLLVSDSDKREEYGKAFLGLVVGLAIVTILLLVAGILCFTHIGHLKDSFEGGITNAMSLYRGKT